jgi:hypothetical protein
MLVLPLHMEFTRRGEFSLKDRLAAAARWVPQGSRSPHHQGQQPFLPCPLPSSGTLSNEENHALVRGQVHHCIAGICLSTHVA